jgi:hypothetical protein
MLTCGFLRKRGTARAAISPTDREERPNRRRPPSVREHARGPRTSPDEEDQPVSVKLPITGRWAQTRPGMISLDFPAVPFVAIYDDGGGHVTLTVSRHESETVQAILCDLLRITEGNDGH